MKALVNALLDVVTGHARVIVPEGQRAILMYDGNFSEVLESGFYQRKRRGLSVELSAIEGPRLKNACLSSAAPAVLQEWFSIIVSGTDEVTVLMAGDKIVDVIRPDEQAVYWRDVVALTVHRFDLRHSLIVEDWLALELKQQGFAEHLHTISINEADVGLVTSEGDLREVLSSGDHPLWNLNWELDLRNVHIGLKRMTLSNFHAATKDGVSISLTVVVGYRVIDPLKVSSLAKSEDDDGQYEMIEQILRANIEQADYRDIEQHSRNKSSRFSRLLCQEIAALGMAVTKLALSNLIVEGHVGTLLPKRAVGGLAT